MLEVQCYTEDELSGDIPTERFDGDLIYLMWYDAYICFHFYPLKSRRWRWIPRYQEHTDDFVCNWRAIQWLGLRITHFFD